MYPGDPKQSAIYSGLITTEPVATEALEMMVFKREISPKYMAELFRSVNYDNLPRFIDH